MPQSPPAKIEDEVKMLSAEGYWREKILGKKLTWGNVTRVDRADGKLV